MKIVVDHVSGSRRGQRQVFEGVERVTIGRHPKNDISFDAKRDLDASARHAELRMTDVGCTLKDVGSSNGTLVAGQRVAQIALVPGEAVSAQFGAGGPILRIWVGPEGDIPEIEPVTASRLRSRAILLVAVVLVLVAAAVVWGLWR